MSCKSLNSVMHIFYPGPRDIYTLKKGKCIWGSASLTIKLGALLFELEDSSVVFSPKPV